MDSKILKCASAQQGFVIGFLFCLLTLLVSWMTNSLSENMSSKSGVNPSAFMWALCIALNHCFISRFPYTGAFISAGEASGVTLALTIFFWPLPVWEIGLIWIGLYVVSHCSSLARIARLKKQGYTEELH